MHSFWSGQTDRSSRSVHIFSSLSALLIDIRVHINILQIIEVEKKTTETNPNKLKYINQDLDKDDIRISKDY